MRLDKFLSDCKVSARKELKQMIRKGLVEVDGAVVKDPGFQLDPACAQVCCCGQTITYTKYIYLMMNKPPGVISATFDNVHQTVIDLLEPQLRQFEPFPVGRLDIDTEGLLLLTNDGVLAHQMLAPKYKVPKVYYARVDMPLSGQDTERFRGGIALKGYTTQPATLQILEDGCSAEVTICEGKFHQVKNMFAACGKTVTYLKRISFAGLDLDENLAAGEYRHLTPEELEKVNLGNLLEK